MLGLNSLEGFLGGFQVVWLVGLIELGDFGFCIGEFALGRLELQFGLLVLPLGIGQLGAEGFESFSIRQNGPLETCGVLGD